MSTYTAKGKESEPPDKLPPPEDVNDDGADDAVPEEGDADA